MGRCGWDARLTSATAQRASSAVSGVVTGRLTCYCWMIQAAWWNGETGHDICVCVFYHCLPLSRC